MQIRLTESISQITVLFTDGQILLLLIVHTTELCENYKGSVYVMLILQENLHSINYFCIYL